MHTMPTFDDIAARFTSVDQDLRLAMLLDYAKKLPPLPPDLRALRDQGFNRVPECMTPVYLWLRRSDAGTLDMHIDVAEEAPTVKGFLSIIHAACAGQPPSVAAAVPLDLIARLGLDTAIRMQRAAGIHAIIARIRREAGALAAPSEAAP
jgi:cysteine desulfuration protein SufE